MPLSKYWLLLLVTFTTCRALAQEEPFTLIDTAIAAFNDKDTARCIRHLEQYADTYPESSLVCFTNSRLAELYMGQKRYEAALPRLTVALKTSHKRQPNYLFTAPAYSFLHGTKYLFLKSTICVQISDANLQLHNPSGALTYLDSAARDYFTYSECANGIIMYHTSLSLKYADVYTCLGDTGAAIKALLQYCLWGEYKAKEATIRLRALLLTKYTPGQIKKTLTQGVAASYGATASGGSKKDEHVYLSLFGYAIRWVPFSSATELRRFLQKSEDFRLLRDGVRAASIVRK